MRTSNYWPHFSNSAFDYQCRFRINGDSTGLIQGNCRSVCWSNKSTLRKILVITGPSILEIFRSERAQYIIQCRGSILIA